MVFFDAVATGHRGHATVHSDSSTSTLDRLVTLMKRDSHAQTYTDQYLRKLLAMSVDIVVFMKNFKIHEIAEVPDQFIRIGIRIQKAVHVDIVGQRHERVRNPAALVGLTLTESESFDGPEIGGDVMRVYDGTSAPLRVAGIKP